MLRLALIPFALVVAALVLLAVLPGRENVVPGGAVELEDVVVTLYPRTDPDAVWYFATPHAEYVPSTQEATLHSVEDGRRTVAGETDFTLHSSQVTIDRSENLRGDEMVPRAQALPSLQESPPRPYRSHCLSFLWPWLRW